MSFLTRFQFVEFEVREAAWTEREVKLSSLLNADLPPELQDILETRVRPFPFADLRDVEVEVPAMAGDQLAYTQSGDPYPDSHDPGRDQRPMERSEEALPERIACGFGWLARENTQGGTSRRPSPAMSWS